VIDFKHGVSLGPLKRDNIKKYFDARNNYQVWKWCRQYDVLTEDSHETWFKKVQASKSIRMYEVLLGGENLSGVCGLTDIDHVNQRAEFSLYIFPDKMGDGIGTMALKTLLDHAFNNLNLFTVWGETFEGNQASELFEKIGFQKEGNRKNFYFREGKFIDAILYSIGRNKWQKSLSA